MDPDRSLAIIPRTKNGRLVACEPCQRRKYACDRAFPTCQRCQRSRTKTPCRYLNQTSQNHQTSAIHSGNSTIIFPSLAQNRSTFFKDSLHALNSPVTAESTQTEPSFIIFDLNTRLNKTKSLPERQILSSQHYGRASSGPSAKDLQVALDVLASLPSPDAEHILAKPHINPFDGWIPLSTTRLLVELRNAFPYAFLQERNEKHLEAVALTIFSNTTQKFPDSQWDRPEEWYTSFSGPNTRWELIGLLFSSWTLSALQNKEDIDGYRPRVLALKFFGIMESCITFCQDIKAHNVLFLYLLYRTSIVSSILQGPNDPSFWPLHSETVSFACSMGLNTISDTSIQDPRFLKQSERRLFTAIYILDKTAATLRGKLPLLVSDHCSTALPLDICNTILLRWRPGQGVNLTSFGVNDEGWNVDGKIYSTTTLRARGLIAHIREQILNLALNKRVRDPRELITLRSQQVHIFNGLPSSLRLADVDLKIKFLEPHVLYTKLFIRLEHLQNLFLIEKLLQKTQPSQNFDGLVQTSLDIISVTVTFWTRNDTLLGMQGDHEWFIIGYALPAAVVLCRCLIETESHGCFTPSISSIIQQLSLLGAFLDWLLVKVPCTEHSYRAKDLIFRVLDRALNPKSNIINRSATDSTVEKVCLDDLTDIDTFSWFV
ncbi:Zn(2)-C6 fungal-type domain-containing protein [Trichoderma simmonsii]|uniref:Zn(2)-C6 fungal-type domain-containing protein n=1 Tax=Trichoderma simmonsii TaxID=1491479 RepID=A0A8G0L943_9HYPO|nr:Zn(2)-C6 fungal-type domain-containing protein [Trichoderma simmonsii]